MSTSAPAALQVSNVSKKFSKGELYSSLRDLIPVLTGRRFRQAKGGALSARDFWALREVSFDVSRGEAFGIIGANGAGKSTILKLLTGIMRPTSGFIRVSGRLSALIEVGAGFHADLTGRENIYLNGTILGMSREDIRRRFDAIVDFSGLEEFIDTPVKRYSSGMYARLGFAVAAHVDPDVLIVDEVLSVGDRVFQRKCVERMTRIIKGGATVVFVSHNLRAVAELCDRGLLLEKGRVVRIGSTHEVIKAYLDRAYATRAAGDAEKAVRITRVDVRRPGGGDVVEVTPGEKLRVDVVVDAESASAPLAVALLVTDDDHREIFRTSTASAGAKASSIPAGGGWRCSFELEMHLPRGTFHLGAVLYRQDKDTERECDRWLPAATFFVNSPVDVLGAANLYPKVMLNADSMRMTS